MVNSPTHTYILLPKIAPVAQAPHFLLQDLPPQGPQQDHLKQVGQTSTCLPLTWTSSISSSRHGVNLSLPKGHHHNQKLIVNHSTQQSLDTYSTFPLFETCGQQWWLSGFHRTFPDRGEVSNHNLSCIVNEKKYAASFRPTLI